MANQNPVLPGFHPDPTVCRVGSTVYLATSSFTYFPGVPLYRSTNLIDWEPIGHALTRESQLDTRASDEAAGIYAPTLRHHDGKFYLTTTDVGGDGHLVVHSDDPTGEWSDPIYVDAPGFDPDLFWDDDTCYFTYYTDDVTRRIEQATIDLSTGELGERRTIWSGFEDPHAEAPHIHEREGIYYLTVAEGGTHTGHMVVVARSDDPSGPFEPHSDNPILTHREDYQRDVRAVGHADLLEDSGGDWWLFCLAIRPRGEFPGWHHLGRETFLAPVTWENGWPTVANGELPETIEADLPGDPSGDPDRSPIEYTETDFSGGRGQEWIYHRTPEHERYRFAEDGLRLFGGPETLAEPGTTYLGRRQTNFACHVRASLRFDPRPGEEAGIALVMDDEHHYALGVVGRDSDKLATVDVRIGDASDRLASLPIGNSTTLGIDAEADRYRFLVDGDEIATAQTKYLSTEVAGGFTGVTIGPYASGNGRPASTPAVFERFCYEPAVPDH